MSQATIEVELRRRMLSSGAVRIGWRIFLVANDDALSLGPPTDVPAQR
jgi:hypothetical protein